MPNGNQPTPVGYQQLYQPTLTGQLTGLPTTGPGAWRPGAFAIGKEAPQPQFTPAPWEQHFTTEGVPLYQQTGQTLSELLGRQRSMQEVGGFGGGQLGQTIAGLQRQQTQQRSAFDAFSRQYNLFPYQAHYSAEGMPIHQQSEQSLQALIDRKTQLTSAGGYFGQFDQQIAGMRQQVEEQRAALNRAQAMYQAGGEDVWRRKMEALRHEQYYGYRGGNGGDGGYDQGDEPGAVSDVGGFGAGYGGGPGSQE